MKFYLKTAYFIAGVTALISCKKEHTPDKQEHTPGQSYGIYYTKVKSILQSNCTITCHAPSKGLYDGLPVTLEDDSIITQAAGSIKAVLLDSATITNKRMPPSGQLPDSLTEIVKTWWAKGGKTTD